MHFRLKSGLALGYLPSGQGDVTLVMLHPIGLCAGVYGPLASELAGRYRVLAVDHLGHGESDVPAVAQSIESMAAAVHELIEALAGPRVVLIGCSMGSSVAATVAAMAPKSVAALILSNSSHSASSDRHAALTQRSREAQRGMTAMLDSTIKRWFPADALVNRSEAVATVNGWLLRGDPVVHSWCWLALRDFSYEPLFPALTLPTLVIGGALDGAANPSAVKALAAALPNAEHHEVAGSAHLSPFDQPRDFARAVDHFLHRKIGTG
jgi:(E)-2-((N-methylformamido)methylene)succinate hydrolase